MADPDLYRTRDEIESWKERDPLTLFEARLREQGLVDDARVAEVEREVADELEAAIVFADESPWEPVEELEQDVYTPAAQ
jgi:pyruvate dehydrogenase E1 component alpha subunit